MARLSAADWMQLQVEYRTGLFSNRQLAEKYGVDEAAIRKRACKEEWGKDLSQQVKAEINSRLLRVVPPLEADEGESPRKSAVRTFDAQLVSAAAATGVEIITRHRKTIARAQRLVGTLLARAETAADNEELPLDKQVQVVKELSVAAKNWIGLERQAFNLDAQEQAAPYEEQLKKLVADAQ